MHTKENNWVLLFIFLLMWKRLVCERGQLNDNDDAIDDNDDNDSNQ